MYPHCRRQVSRHPTFEQLQMPPAQRRRRCAWWPKMSVTIRNNILPACALSSIHTWIKLLTANVRERGKKFLCSVFEGSTFFTKKEHI